MVVSARPNERRRYAKRIGYTRDRYHSSNMDTLLEMEPTVCLWLQSLDASPPATMVTNGEVHVARSGEKLSCLTNIELILNNGG